MRAECPKYADNIVDKKILIPPTGTKELCKRRIRATVPVHPVEYSASVLQHDCPIGTDAI